jgi:hypothetical protein
MNPKNQIHEWCHSRQAMQHPQMKNKCNVLGCRMSPCKLSFLEGKGIERRMPESSIIVTNIKNERPVLKGFF